MTEVGDATRRPEFKVGFGVKDVFLAAARGVQEDFGKLAGELVS